jgi:hypothetical protein
MGQTSSPCKNSVVSKHQQQRGRGLKMGQSSVEEGGREQRLRKVRRRRVFYM